LEGASPSRSSATASVRQRSFRFADGSKVVVRLETAFWTTLEEIAGHRGIPLEDLVREVAEGRNGGPLPSVLRMYALDTLRAQNG
jgi:predicted DNA-binding ribbon-helix-helix protein